MALEQGYPLKLRFVDTPLAMYQRALSVRNRESMKWVGGFWVRNICCRGMSEVPNSKFPMFLSTVASCTITSALVEALDADLALTLVRVRAVLLVSV